MDKISKDKQYTTRDGRDVRIYATDGRGVFPVHGAIKYVEGWTSVSWCEDGMHLGNNKQTEYDLIEVKPRIKIERWIIIDYAGFTQTSSVKPCSVSESIFAVKHIVFEVEEGEGLDAV